MPRGRYVYLLEVTSAAWNKHRGSAGGSIRARAQTAAKLERDVRDGIEKVDLAQARAASFLNSIHWIALADNSLKRFADYEGLP